nr:hypothetical protein [Candidatus Sigynarchaeota archaeon]
MQRRKLLFAIIAAGIFITTVYLVITGFLGLEASYPGQFTFNINMSDLTVQANGLAWTLTIILVLFYWVSGFYLIMEARVSTTPVQKTFHNSLAALFLLIGLAQGIVVFYSITSRAPFNFATLVIPDMAPFGRSDALFAIAIACLSTVPIIHSIEKHIKNSKKFPITTIIVIGSIAGLAGIICSFIQAATWPTPPLGDPPVPEWWQYVGYATIGLPGIGIILAIIALPVIYFSLAGQSSGALRKNSLTIAIGFLITFVMVLLHLLRDMLLQDMPLNWMVFIFGNIIGAAILMAGYIRSTY